MESKQAHNTKVTAKSDLKRKGHNGESFCYSFITIKIKNDSKGE